MQNVSKARTIFNATDEAKPLNPNDFDFALAEDESAGAADHAEERRTGLPVGKRESGASRRIAKGMTPVQIAVVAALEIALVCPRRRLSTYSSACLEFALSIFIHRHSSIQRRKPPARNIGAGFRFIENKIFYRGDRGGKRKRRPHV
ncbi:MAG: hypothetical protein U0X92_13195 [Anaerolineales bacterium]